LLRRSRTRGGRDLVDRLWAAGRRIREHLDTERVLRAAVHEVQGALHAESVSVWLTTGNDRPRLGCDTNGGPSEPADEVLRAIGRAARRARPVRVATSGRPSGLAVPIVAPRSGPLGVIYVRGFEVDSEREEFIRALASETGFALETANLYELAVAAKDRSEAVLARVGDAVAVTDAKGTILEWNAAAQRVMSCPGQRAIGAGCEEIMRLHEGERRLDCTGGCALLASHGSDDTILGTEVWRERPDGRRQPLLATVATVNDADGAVAEVVHSFRDITRLKEADEAKTMFLATASHELRTPLTVIQGFAEALSSSPSWNEDERREALGAMERRAHQLNKILNRLLLSSRIEAGRVKLTPSEIDLSSILTERAIALSAASDREVELDLSADFPQAYADADAISSVLDHLLDNAIKYSPGGGPVRVHATYDDSRVLVEVSDGGIGMDAEQIAHCFDKFWQAESSDHRRFGGTGIGLYIVRSLVEAMDGRVTVQSVPGEGSTFQLELRRRAPEPVTNGSPLVDEVVPGVGEASIIREFMRQIGVPARPQARP
jgi:PAS domain S-box-containing protein